VEGKKKMRKQQTKTKELIEHPQDSKTRFNRAKKILIQQKEIVSLMDE
jgi:hypothetical protein